MPYHLGVAKTFLMAHEPNERNDPAETNPQSNALSRLPIRSVSGSSSGAIAATVMTRMPHRLEEYTDRFLQDRGHAFRNLREMLSEPPGSGSGAGGGFADPNGIRSGPVLSICTTRCSDGGIELFSFGGGGGDDDDGLESGVSDDAITKDDTEISDHQRVVDALNRAESERKKHLDLLLKAVEASCRIPRSFHPVDMVALNYKDWLSGIGKHALLPGTSLGGSRDTYPCEEGVAIDGKGYADGGIAAPFPPTLLDGDPACTGRIVVSPIAGEYFYKTTTASDRGPRLEAIRPEIDDSWRAPWIGSVTLGGSSGRDGSPPVAVRAVPSLQNLRVLTTAMGVVSSAGPDPSNDAVGGPATSGGILRDWYERGQADAHEALHRLSPLPQ